MKSCRGYFLVIVASAALLLLVSYIFLHHRQVLQNQVDYFESKPAVQDDLKSLPQLSNVTLFKHCDAYNELRQVRFVDPKLKYRLCADTPVYTLVDGSFPLCQLNRQLPSQFYEIVNKTARIASVHRAMHRSRMPVYTFSEQDMISREMLQKGSWETAEISWILQVLKKFPTGDVTFMDIGSNLGLYSLQAREEGFPVIAVDANIRTLIRMQMTARKLGILDARLKLFWCFLDEEVALKKMNWVALTHDCHIGGASSGSTNWVFRNPTMDTIPVMTARTDDLISHVGTKKIVVKMDIESGEHMFMRTGVKLFHQFDIVLLQMEFWRNPGTAAQSSPFYSFITKFMTDRGYSLISASTHQLLDVATFNDWDGIWVRKDFLKLVLQP